MPRSTLSGQTGFTLIEVLVAALVLALGMLGLAALQVTSLSNSHSSYLRSQATQLAYDLSDRIRANPIGLRSGSYNNQPVQTAACLTTVGCSAAELAKHDVYEWNADLASQLPSGSGVICLDTSPDDGTPASPACSGDGTVYVIKIWWNEYDPDPDPTDPDIRKNVSQRFVTSFQP